MTMYCMISERAKPLNGRSRHDVEKENLKGRGEDEIFMLLQTALVATMQSPRSLNILQQRRFMGCFTRVSHLNALSV